MQLLKSLFLKVFLFVGLLLLGLTAVTQMTYAAPATDGHTTASVATGALNIRSGPGVGYSIVVVAYEGHNLTLLGRNSNSSWVKVRTVAGQEGWVNASYISTTVSISSLTVLATPTLTPRAAVATGALNVREGPGTTYNGVTVLSYGENVTLIGRNINSSWVKIRTDGGKEGWVNASLITANVVISSLPVVGAPAAPPAANPGAGEVEMRSGPGFEYGVVGLVYHGQDVTMIGRSSDSAWIKIVAGTQQGWVRYTVVQSSVAISSLPVVGSTTTISPNSGPTATVGTGALNMRSGAGLAYNVITVLYQGQTITLLGRNSNSSWVKVRTVAGQEGWVNAAYLTNYSTSVSSLPVSN